jgi:hypothetical protein
MTVCKSWYEDFRNKVKDGYKVIVNPRTKGKSTFKTTVELKNKREKDLYVVIDECAWDIHERNKT